MRILIIGASSKMSLGYQLGEQWKKERGHDVFYASRSGKLGSKCDVTDHRQVLRLVEKTQPDTIIQAAGIFFPAQELGKIEDYKKIQRHILAKTYGTLLLLDAAARVKRVGNFVVLGGREVSGLSGYAGYTCGNGGAWALIQFAARHLSQLRTFFVDLPLVDDTTMGLKFKADYGTLSARNGPSVDAEGVLYIVSSLVEGSVAGHRIGRSGDRLILNQDGERIVLGEGWVA